jgi:hypothetical protein
MVSHHVPRLTWLIWIIAAMSPYSASNALNHARHFPGAFNAVAIKKKATKRVLTSPIPEQCGCIPPPRQPGQQRGGQGDQDKRLTEVNPARMIK